MPTYKLTYFNVRARAEVARQMFHLAGVPFEDVRIPREDWLEYKNNTPFGQLPFLEVDGEVLPQSFAINRYVAKEFGFAGKTPFEEAWVDAVADQYKDYYFEMRPAIHKVFRESDLEEKQKLVQDVGVPTRDKHFSIFENVAKENGSNGHFVGSSLTWVDLLLAEHVSILLSHLPGFLDDFPIVLDTVKKIHSTPKLKEWLAKRPETSY